MEKNKPLITGQELLALGYPERKVIGAAINVAQQYYSSHTLEETNKALEAVLLNPTLFIDDNSLSQIAKELIATKDQVLQLKDTPDLYKVNGAAGIEQGALNQIEIAMRLPITKAGALMPDAHPGYGLPIGGVLATENAVIPYGVGVDIGCSMCMTIYDLPETMLDERKEELKQMLIRNTKFGKATFKKQKIMKY